MTNVAQGGAHMPLTTLDIDGVVAIGVLPLVTHMTPYPLFLKNPHKSYFEMTSLYLNDLYKDYYSYRIGTVNGYNFNLFTNIDPSQMKDVFAHFLQYAYSEGIEVGIENRHLTVGSDGDYNTIVTRLNENASQFRFSNQTVLDTFATWVSDHFTRHFPTKTLLGSIIKMGQKDPSLDLRLDCIVPQLLRHSALHLGFNFVGPDFFALKADLFGRSRNCKVYHPLGLVHLATVEVLKHDAEAIGLLCPGAMPNIENLNSVKVYIDWLKNCRVPTLRRERSKARIASHKTLGRNGHLVDSPYRVDCELSQQLVRSYETAITAIQNQMEGHLRFEYIFDSILDLDPQAIQASISQHLNASLDALTNSIPVADIPFDRGANQALAIIKEGSPYDLPRLVCAESYIGYLVDGNIRRVYYDGLKVALSSDLYGALARASIDGDPMVLPASPDFSHVRWESLDLNQLSAQVQFHLYLPDDQRHLAMTLLTRLSECLQERLGRGNNYEATHAVSVAVELMEASIPQRFGGDLKQRGKHIVKSIGYKDLARCLLHPRVMRGRGNRGLHLCIVLSHLYDYDPNLSDVQRKVYLTDLLGRTPAVKLIEVWPLGEPIYSQNTFMRYAAVSEDTQSLHFVMGTLRESSPNTEIPTHYGGVDLRGWGRLPDIFGEIRHRYHSNDERRRSVRSQTQKTNFACLWLLVTMTAAEQQRLADPNYHLRIDRFSCEQHFQMLNRHLAILRDFGLINEDLNRGRRAREYLFNFLYVPRDFHRRLARFPDQPSPPPPEAMEVNQVDRHPDLDLDLNRVPEPVPEPEPEPMTPEPVPEPEPEPVQDPDADLDVPPHDQLPVPPMLEVVGPRPDPPPPPLVNRRPLPPRVPVQGPRTHRERFCRPRVVRDESLPDNPRRRPRNRSL